MNPVEIFEMPVDLEEPLKELISHLQGTGTGVSKLRTLAAIGLDSDGPDEFLAAAKLAVPDGTWAKIEDYVKEKQARRKDEEEAKAKLAASVPSPEKLEDATEPVQVTQENASNPENSQSPSELEKPQENAKGGHRNRK